MITPCILIPSEYKGCCCFFARSALSNPGWERVFLALKSRRFETVQPGTMPAQTLKYRNSTTPRRIENQSADRKWFDVCVMKRKKMMMLKKAGPSLRTWPWSTRSPFPPGRNRSIPRCFNLTYRSYLQFLNILPKLTSLIIWPIHPG